MRSRPRRDPLTPRGLWSALATPATLWLLAFFVVPFYVLLSVAFGGLDTIFLTPEPIYDPLAWDLTAFRGVVTQLLAGDTIHSQTFLRTVGYVAIATALCLAIGYPFAYFLARHAGRWKALFLVLFVAPFWISYMMRMFAWVNLLQEDGYVNRILTSVGILSEPRLWLAGDHATVILGLVYGYVPYMVLPLFATLDRIDRATLEAARDMGAGQRSTFLRVTLPLSKQGIFAGCVIVTLPMFGDYFTQTLLAGTRHTAMFGNLIVSSIDSSLVNAGASLVIVLLLLLLLPMLSYLRSTGRARGLMAV